MDSVRQRVRNFGWKEDSIMLGVASDMSPSRATTDMFRRVAPYARWIINSHFWPKEINGVEVGYTAVVHSNDKSEGMGVVKSSDSTSSRFLRPRTTSGPTIRRTG